VTWDRPRGTAAWLVRVRWPGGNHSDSITNSNIVTPYMQGGPRGREVPMVTSIASYTTRGGGRLKNKVLEIRGVLEKYMQKPQ
jgi:hypothetical protein